MAASTSEHVPQPEDEPKKTVPDDIQLESCVINVCFHPSKDVIATCTIDNDVLVYSYSIEEQNHNLLTLNHHTSSCRGVEFNGDGQLLFSISKDLTLQAVDMNTGVVAHKIVDAHESPIYSLLVIDDYLVATGDDDGVLKVWDYRCENAIFEQNEMEDNITDMAIDDAKKILLATSGEGTLTAFNIRAKRMELQSELFDAGMGSVAIIKRGSKVVVGDEDGAINIFNWGEWGNISDRFPGNTSSIEKIQPITENIICTGSADGKIRAVNILPNRFIGVVGEHAFSVDGLSLSRDEKLLASCSSDETIKFWDISYLHNKTVSDRKKAKSGMKNKHLQSSKTNNSFFADL